MLSPIVIALDMRERYLGAKYNQINIHHDNTDDGSYQGDYW